MTDSKELKELERQIKQDLMQKDKEVIIELYLQMKFERDYCQKQLETNQNQKAVEALEKSNVILDNAISETLEEMCYDGCDFELEDIKTIARCFKRKIDQFIKEYGGKE